ncbi:MFS transporter [Nocardia brasiliensis]|uniref:MFS transporter n=1 Tax=Nocardia brasiliensis TaxID=37326 RepID=UPI003D93B8B0
MSNYECGLNGTMIFGAGSSLPESAEASTTKHDASSGSPRDADRTVDTADRAVVAKFREIFELPGVPAFVGVVFAARIPATAKIIVLTLHVVLALDRGYYAAGLVTAAYTVGRAIGAPLMGLLVDRRGLRTMLAVTTTAEGLFWMASPACSFGVLLVATLAGGLLGIPLQTVVRQSLAAMVPATARRQAFSVDAMSIDLSYILGPSLGALLLIHGSSTIALRLIGMSCVAVGLTLWIMNRPTRTTTPDLAADQVRQQRRTSLAAIFLVAIVVSILIFSTELAVIAGLQSRGQAGYFAVVCTAWCVASAAGGFLYGGARRHPGLCTLVVGLGLATLPLGLATYWWSYALLLIPAGLLCAPAVAAGSEQLSARTPEDSRGVLSGLYDSANAFGAGIAAPMTGWLIDSTTPAEALATVALLSVVLTMGTGMLVGPIGSTGGSGVTRRRIRFPPLRLLPRSTPPQRAVGARGGILSPALPVRALRAGDREHECDQ